MRLGMVLSLLAHVAIVLAAVVTLPSVFDAADEFQMVPIEILQLGDETNVRAAAPDIVEKPEPEAVKEEERRFAEAPPPPPAMNEPVDDDAMPALDKRVDPKPKPETKKMPARKKMPRRKPKSPAPENNDELDLGEIEALLDKAPKEEPKPQVDPSDDALDALDDFLAEDEGNLPRRAIGLGDGLTVSEVDALRQAMVRCWRVPIGAPNPEEYVVTLKIFLNEEGGDLSRPSEVVSATGRGIYRTNFEEAALNAVKVCAPYEFLPKDKYEYWKILIMEFDPFKMAGY